MLIPSRRQFLRTGLKSAAALGAAGSLMKIGEMNALAGGGNYRALVCIFLLGGNDGHNTVIPIQTSAQSFTPYQTARQSLALPLNSLLHVVTKSGDTYGLHPQLKELQSLYQSGAAAIVANVGNLAVPILNRTAYLGGAAVPANLFSHSDQTNQWETSIPNGIASTGWGGRLADFMQSQNAGAQFPSVATTSGCGLFCSGSQTFPTTVPPSGAISLNTLANNSARKLGSQQLLTFDNGLKLVQAANGIVTRGETYANTLNGLISSVHIQTPFPAGNPLGAQLNMVAKLIGLRSQLGLSRQVFFCTLGGFDTHGGQLAAQDALLAQLSPAIGAFYAATQELGVQQEVTTFTNSEFGRTLMPNSSGGTDHAWGSHHFVIGGGVVGADMYGAFPQLALGGPNDANNRGTMIPGYSVAQYASTLAQWFGVAPAGMASIVPNIGNFPMSNLGFLG